VSDSAANLRRKIASGEELWSVVHTMKAMAASSVGQYENAVRALDDYYHAVQLGLVACLRQRDTVLDTTRPLHAEAIGAVVFGSDQGLVGQFNEAMAEFVVGTLGGLPGKKIVWAVGERIQSRLADTGLRLGQPFPLPNSIGAITPLLGHVLTELEARREKGEIAQVVLFHHRPEKGATCSPVSQRLLPLDDQWRRDLGRLPWPSGNLPEVMNGFASTFLSFVREYLFVSLFRACADSLASENASRLAAMQRAEKNIEELLEDLKRTFHQQRQGSIDEELFEVIAGFEALSATRG